jgi:hypothetical protein
MSPWTGSKLIVGIGRIKVNRWNWSDHSNKKIKVFIRAELDELNWSAGLQICNNEYCDSHFLTACINF